MIYLQLRQAGEIENYKRVEHLFAQAGQWTLLFDRTAEGHSIKSLMVVNDAAHEALTIVS